MLPESNLHAVPDSVTDRQAVFAELLAAAIQVVRQVPPPPGRKAVVLGDGRLGLLVAQVLRINQAAPVVVGRSPAKLAILEPLGIAGILVENARPAHDAALVVECTGTADGLAMALRFVRPRGTIVLKSTVADTAGLDLAPIVVNEITVVGSRCGPMAEALAMLDGGQVQVEPLITAEYTLDEAPQALRAAASPGSIKVLIRP